MLNTPLFVHRCRIITSSVTKSNGMERDEQRDELRAFAQGRAAQVQTEDGGISYYGM